MAQPRHSFWQNPEIATYFAEKPADPIIVERLGRYTPSDEARALDLGCGGGRHSEMLAGMGYEVTATDYNPEMLEFTARRLDSKGLSATTVEMAIEALDLPADYFDVIVCTGVLHQVCSLQDYRSALDRIHQTLKPGGLFTMNVFTNDAWDETYEIPDATEPYTVRTREGLYQTLLPADMVIQFAADAGLELDEVAAHDFRQENTGPRSVLRAHFLNRAD